MAQFEDREKSFEAKFAHDEELRFRVMARRNRLVGLWASEKLGLEGEAAQDYAAAVVKADIGSADQDDVYRKVKADLDARAAGVSEHQVRREIDDLYDLARRQIMSETK